MSSVLFDRIAIVGVGLLGGSLGLAAKERGLCREVIGIGRTQPTLDEALRMEAIDRAETDLRAGLADADVVVIATPVRHIIEALPDVMAAAKPGAVVTDVGSTKANIVRAGEHAMVAGGAVFVGSHPMAGSEKTGVRHSRATIYQDSTCFVTKTAMTDLFAFGQVCSLWRAVGARIVISRPDRHDRLVARISHLPHLLAVALVRAVNAAGEDKNLVKGIIGNGFRDTTRIAGGGSQMWEDIFNDNMGELVEARTEFDGTLSRLMTAVESGAASEQELRAMLEEAAELREFLDHR